MNKLNQSDVLYVVNKGEYFWHLGTAKSSQLDCPACHKKKKQYEAYALCLCKWSLNALKSACLLSEWCKSNNTESRGEDCLRSHRFDVMSHIHGLLYQKGGKENECATQYEEQRGTASFFSGWERVGMKKNQSGDRECCRLQESR